MRDTKTNPEPTPTEQLDEYRKALDAKIERLDVKPGDVVLVKPAGESHREWCMDAAKAIGAHLQQRFSDSEGGVMLIIPPGADLEAVNPEMMRQHGWVRAEDCSEFQA